jgi:hypothetical protein
MFKQGSLNQEVILYTSNTRVVHAKIFFSSPYNRGSRTRAVRGSFQNEILIRQTGSLVLMWYFSELNTPIKTHHKRI